MFTKSSSTRHRRVIHQDGSPAADTGTFPRLRFAFLGAPAADVETTLPLPAVGPSRTLPVRGHGTIAMRVPEAPRPVSFPRSFFNDTAFLSHVSQVQVGANAVARGMALEFDKRMQALLRRSREVAAQWRYAAAEGDGLDLAAAYAEGGTEKLLKLTPQVLAAMDARAKAGSGVSA